MRKWTSASDAYGQLFESSDVARELDITPSMVRVYAATGRLRAAVVTPRGARLFRPQDVLDFKKTYRGGKTLRRTLRGDAEQAAVQADTIVPGGSRPVVDDIDSGGRRVHADIDAGAQRHDDGCDEAAQRRGAVGRHVSNNRGARPGGHRG